MAEHTDDPALFRAALRAAQLAQRAALDASVHARHSQAICAHLGHWFARFSAANPSKRRFAFCLPFRDECHILPLAEALYTAGWQAAVPVVESTASPMVFRLWTPQSPLGRDRHGIAIPETATCPPPDVLLLPVVAVDPKGYRLGYGGGYFDRTLAALAASGTLPLCVGVGFAQAQVADIRPQAHDRRLDGLISENGPSAFTENMVRTLATS